MTSPVYAEAIERLTNSIQQAESSGESEANAAALATVDVPTQRPSVRMIYVHVDNLEPIFFVKAQSGKERQLYWNESAGLCFFWRGLGEQVVLDGRIEQLADDRADSAWCRYRSRESALVHHASGQQTHEHAGDPSAFEQRYRQVAQQRRYGHKDIKRPSDWVGYRLLPDRIEFWHTGWQNPAMRELYFYNPDGEWQFKEQEP